MALFAHLTALETPLFWLAFVAGTLTGALGMWAVLRRRAAGPQR